MTERSASLGRQFFAEQDRLRGGPMEALCAPGYQASLGGNLGWTSAGHEGSAKAFYGAFAGLQHRVDRVMATRGVAVENVAYALLQVTDGKVTRLEAVFDEVGMLRQIGVLQGRGERNELRSHDGGPTQVR